MAPNSAAGETEATVIDACAHLDAAAQLLLAATDAVFDPRRALAGQVRLLAAAIHPGIQALPTRSDPLAAADHLDRTLHLLADVPPEADLSAWCAELLELRASVRDAAGTQANRTPR